MIPDRRRTVERYEGHWGEMHRVILSIVESGERDLSRALRLADASERQLSLEEQVGMAQGTRITLPRAAMTGARRELIQRFLLDACTPQTELVVELGAGAGVNLLNLHLWGGPLVPYRALEPAAAGRACADALAALDDRLDLETAPYDYEQPSYEALAPVGGHVLAFTIHSIEQVTVLPAEAITGLLDLGTSVTGLHFEPVGWQILEEPDEASHAYAARQQYNRNLWPLLKELEQHGRLSIETVVPDLFGDKYKNPGTLIVWHSPAR